MAAPTAVSGAVVALVGSLIIVAAASCVLAFVDIAFADEQTHSLRPAALFQLQKQNGQVLSEAELEGKPLAVFFGFTHCPEICPTTLWETSEALKSLGPEAEKLRVIFISVDPSRDTSAFLSRYLESFDPRIIGLTGTEADVEAVGRAFHAYWKRVPMADGDYTMDHTASVYLVDAAGRMAGAIPFGEGMDARLQKLRGLLSGDLIPWWQ